MQDFSSTRLECLYLLIVYFILDAGTIILHVGDDVISSVVMRLMTFVLFIVFYAVNNIISSGFHHILPKRSYEFPQQLSEQNLRRAICITKKLSTSQKIFNDFIGVPILIFFFVFKMFLADVVHISISC